MLRCYVVALLRKKYMCRTKIYQRGAKSFAGCMMDYVVTLREDVGQMIYEDITMLLNSLPGLSWHHPDDTDYQMYSKDFTGVQEVLEGDCKTDIRNAM